MSAAVSKSEAFDEDLFETRLESLKDTQEGIQQMSSWCLQQRAHHKKVVSCWLNVFKRVRVEHRLILFYLANDVIQYSKRKRYEFVESWATALQRATTMVRDEKVKGKVLRIFNIWEQREIYSEEYLSDLSGLLNINPPKKSQTLTIDSSDDFQNGTLVTNVRECVLLSLATDNSFKKLPKAPNCDIETIKHQLKDKTHSEDVEKEIERYITYAEAYSKHLQAEIKSRKTVLSNLDNAIKFYANQRGEVKVVVSAYKNFGSRIKLVKKKLDEITPNLPSPIPSPDINAPSPEPDADLHLPDEQSPISVNLFKNSINGYSSYMDGKLPFDINDFKCEDTIGKSSSHPIQVIGSRSDAESYNSSSEYYKPESISAYSTGNISIPGLNPRPVPPVESGYTSLARSAQQYGTLLPQPNAPMFANNHSNNSLHHGYATPYNPDNSYHSGANVGNSNAGGSIPPLMPPPPMPSLNNSGDGVVNTPANSSDDFNSSWDMQWQTLESTTVSNTAYNRTSIDTPVSPPHFEREPSSSSSATIEYTEHSSSIVVTQDVDHRQLHLSPFGIGAKLGLSKEKTRQLDIDHRNLISLTGSPGGSDSDKKSWLSAEEQNFHTNNIGDVDYRTLQNVELPPASTSNFLGMESTSTPPHNIMAPPSGGAMKKTNSPQKSNASSSSESQKDDLGGTRYDPADMVIDMDMSDEDLDDILREVNEQQSDQLDNSQASTASEDTPHDTSKDTAEEDQLNASAIDNSLRPALLETPLEYSPQNVWDTTPVPQMNISGYGMELEMQQPAPVWNQGPWNNNGGPGGSVIPPPPRPPFPLQFNYPNSSAYRGGRGWANSPQQNQYRNFPRPPRGGPGHHGGSPYFNRGGRGGGGVRGSFRGKFRGNPAWI